MQSQKLMSKRDGMSASSEREPISEAILSWRKRLVHFVVPQQGYRCFRRYKRLFLCEQR